MEILKRSDQAKDLNPAERWVVERPSLGSVAAAGSPDFENLTRIALAFVKLASIRFMLDTL